VIEFLHDPRDHRLICSLTGRLDAVLSAEVKSRIDDWITTLADPDLRIVLNLEGVSFMASAFMRVCISLLKRLPTGHLEIGSCCPVAKQALETAGFDSLLKETGRSSSDRVDGPR